MKEIKSDGDTVFVQENFLSEKKCDEYFNKIKNIGYTKNIIPWSERIVNITDDPIVQKVTDYINKRFNLNLKIDSAEIQNHHVNSIAPLHIHNSPQRKHIIYNSLLYLNDNFGGGEFITKEEKIKIKPKKGMLTFFNGQTIYHGVNRVSDNDRKTIIFWWSSDV